MYPKLQALDFLRTEHPLTSILKAGSHIRYANLDFTGPNIVRRAASLVEAVCPPGWSDERTLRYLARHQDQFRRCLAWLSEGSTAYFDVPDDGLIESWIEIRQKWAEKPEVQFLQQHGLDHAKMTLHPASQDGNDLAGIELGQERSQDPLDRLCFYLLSLLMWDGTVGARRCKNVKCGKFFRPLTARKTYCSDLCRASVYMGKKSRKEKAAYMREHRAILKERAKSKSGTPARSR
jgi:hypothetical protein